jgi:hypothetical protein
MKTWRDSTHYRNENIKRLLDALIIELAHERAAVPPVPLLFDLDTAAMFLGMGRNILIEFCKTLPDFTYKKNQLTKQRFLTGEDIQRIRKLVITDESTQSSSPEKRKKLPAIKQELEELGS